MAKKKATVVETNEVAPPPAWWRSRSALLATAAAVVLLLGAAIVIAFRSSGDPGGSGASRAAGDQPDIILITIDTLRADAVGFAGNDKVETPFLDRLAREGRVFTNAYAHNVVTLPSHANILTGLYPYQHGIRDNAGFTLDAKHRTVAAMLRDEGYATGAFVGAFPVDSRFGLDQGFDIYDDGYAEGSNPLEFVIAERRAPAVLEPATKWFQSMRGKPRFLWIHLYDPHAPYEPPEAFATRYWNRKYLGEIAAVDAALETHLGPIIDGQHERKLMTIVTADHGESLGEHGELTHGLFTYDATLKVPLLVHEKNRVAPGADDRVVRHIDIVPTILERSGIGGPPNLPGESLFHADAARDGYFEALSAALNRGWAPLVGLIHGQHKYIDLPLPELYDLASDPQEKHNVVEEQRRVVFKIRELLKKAAPAAGSATRQASTEEAANLLSLGYFTGSAAQKQVYTAEDDPKNLVDVDSMMHEVVHLYQLGQVDRALRVAREIVRRRPGMGVGEEMLAFVLQQNEKVEDAITTLQTTVARGDATPAIKRRLGLMLSETGQAKEAVGILRPLVKQSGEDVELLNAYGIALADTGDLRSAAAEFQRVLQIDRENADAYQNLGIVSLRAGQDEAARRHLEQALRINPRLPLALTTLGVIHMRSGRAGDAIDVWAKAISIDPRQFDAMYNLGIVAARVGRTDEARNALRQFVDTAPPKRYGRDIVSARKLLDTITNRSSSAQREVSR